MNRMTRVRSDLLLATILLPAVMLFGSPLSAQGGATGTLTGRVTSAEWGGYLEGASVRLPDLGLQTITNREGRFHFPRVPQGRHTVIVSYLGVASVSSAVAITAAQATVHDVALENTVVALSGLTVTGQVQGQAAAINLQRTADNLRTVVSQDALGQSKEGNIGDALARLPGVVVETRAGVQRTATIRGLLPQYNNVTVDGLPMTNVDGNRDIALDSYPSNTLERVEVIRALTPDMPGDAIGGTVNLVTRTAFDRPGRTLLGSVGGTHNEKRQNWNQQAELTFGDRIGQDRRLGFLLTGAYYEDNRGYDVSNIGYAVSPDGQFTVANNFIYDRYERKQKVGLGANLNFRPTEESHLYVKGIYNYDYRWLNHRGVDWRPANNQVNGVAFYREPKNVFDMYIAGGEHRTREWSVDYRGSYSRAVKTYPATYQITTGFNGVTLATDRTDPNFPTYSITNGANLSDPSRMVLRNMQTTQAPREEDELVGEFNVGRAFAGFGPFLILKAGARYSAKDASQAQPEYARFTSGGVAPGSLIESYTNDRFFLEANGRAGLLPIIPDHVRWYETLRSQSQLFTRVEPFSSQGVAASEFQIAERITSTYGMATTDLGPVRLIGGVRLERTANDATANEIRTERVGGREQVTAVTPRTSTSSYLNVLPGLHARLEATPGLIVRSSWTNTISRPAPGDLIPSMQVNAQLTQPAVIIGNPDLKPAESMNLDASAEYYLPALGFLSAAVYHKRIDDFVFNERTRLNSGPFAGFDEVRRVNGDGGRVSGLELAYVQQLTFLPGALSGFALEGNVSFVDSEGVYPGREAESLPLAGPAKRTANAILSYTVAGFNGRISLLDRTDRLGSVGARAALDRYNAADRMLDFASSYRLPGRTGSTLFFNVHNLLNTPTVEYQGNAANPTSTTYYGRQVNFGVRAGL